jgi:MFS family permease
MLPTLRNRALAKIYVIPLFFTTTAMMTWAIGVLYALDLGADILQVNLITTIWSVMGIVLLIPFGILSDRLGRKPMLLYPRVINLAATLIRVLATNPTHLLLAAFIGGFAGAGFFPILVAMIADIAQPHEQKEAVGVLFLFSSIGMLIGPLVGSFLLTTPYATLRTLYQIDVVAQGATLLYILTQVTETKPPTPHPTSPRDHAGFRSILTDLRHQPGFLGLLLMSFCFSLFFAIMSTYIPIYGRVDLQLSDAEVSSFSTLRSLGVLLIRFASTTLLAAVPIPRFLLAALVLGGVTGFLAPLATTFPAILGINVLYGVSFGATMILGNTLVTLTSTPKNRGTANSTYNAAQSAGNILKMATSPLAETLGLTAVFLVGGVAALLAAIPVLLQRGKDALTKR